MKAVWKTLVITGMVVAAGTVHPQSAKAESIAVYDLVAPALIQPLAEDKEPKKKKKKKFVPTLKLAGAVDFDSAKGTASSLDIEVGAMLPPFAKKLSLTPGVLAGIKDNDEITSWKAGGQVRIELPAYNQILSPYARAAVIYQDPDSGADPAVVGTGGIGLSILVARNDCYKSAIEVELAYSKATEDIYDKNGGKVDHDLIFTLGLKLFLF